MNESEFRDWARRAQGSFDERLKRLEEKVGGLDLAQPRVREAEAYDRIARLYSDLGVALKVGDVTALGVSFITADGEVRTGWANETWDRFALAGAVSQLWLEIMDRAKDEARDAAGAASGAAGEPTKDPGLPEARELAGSAPAEGIVA